ncbi:hypothetical protein OWR28_23460 [Chryseobacterium sp. 1B4]
MKKNILFLLVICLVASCATKTKKPEQRSRVLKGFSTYYNTLFNAKDALNSEFTARDKGHKDNFYAPYIPILTYEEQPLGSDLGQTEAFAENSIKMAEVANRPSGRGNSGVPNIPGGPPGGGPSRPDGEESKGATTLEIAEAKALKAINKYSVTRNGEEKNKQIFDAYMILAQARIYRGKSLEALDALNYVFTHMKDDKRIALARIYQGLAYDKIKDYHRAHETFAKLKGEDINKSYAKLLSIYYAESLLDAGKKKRQPRNLTMLLN